MAKKYKSPNPHPTFTKVWNMWVDEIVKRDNFKPGHLHQLEIFCDLHVEYEQLKASLELTGMSYESDGRNGPQVKLYPEVQQKNRVMTEIRNYAKMLGLVLVKDTDFSNDNQQEDSWE